MRRRIGLLSSLALLPAAATAGITGLTADLLDLHNFVVHIWAGYATAVLAIVHVVAYWPLLVSRTRALGRRGPRPARNLPIGLEPGPGAVTVSVRSRPEGTAEPAGVGPAPAGLLSRRKVLVAGAGGAGLALGWLARDQGVGVPWTEGDLGAAYHRASSPDLGDLFGALVEWGTRPPRVSRHPQLPRRRLPAPTLAELQIARQAAMPIDAVLESRRSRRSWNPRSLTLAELSWLLWATNGRSGPEPLRTVPSAGAQHALELYVAAQRVTGIEQGLHYYDPLTHELAFVRPGNFATQLTVASLGQGFVGDAPATIVVAAIFQRLRWRYRERAYRYALLEAGHAGQNLYLAAEATGLATVAVGAFFDGQINGLLDLDGEREATLCIYPVAARA
jgi:SagB-type dehydrogenase family enzyme